MNTTSDEDTKHCNASIENMKVKHLTIAQLTKLMSTTPYEDTQYFNEVVGEIKVSRERRGRPKIYTPEELLERKRESDRKRYHKDPQKKIEANRRWRQQLKLQ